MAKLRIVGVRHHSPACARLVKRVIDECAPAMVLIEGPADMNERLDELRLGHRLPVAVYSYRLDDDSGVRARGTWSPFCDYSPEWVALTHATGRVFFIDLPAWDDAFVDCVNRYADGLLTRLRWSELAQAHGFDCSDALWDHLFEANEDDLEVRLGAYFDALRGDDQADAMDARREAYMAAWIGWALGQVSKKDTVLVVCGGYHAPVFRSVRPANTSQPTCPRPEKARVGSFLVPFSFKRLDSFAGYASGMPSPAFYQAAWEQSAGAAERMLGHAVQRLRKIGQVVSAADHAAASTLCQGLARMRGHAAPTRVDSLDGLVGALLKEPLDAPLPWSERQVLRPGTAPLLVEIVAAYSGERRGKLAEGTPMPPLVGDAHAELGSVGLALAREAARVELSCADPATQRARSILHRLRVLEIDGVELTGKPSLERGKAAWSEYWSLIENDATLPALIERAVYGATLAHAARARLEERMAQARDLIDFVAALQDAMLASLPHLADALSAAALGAVEKETQLGSAGAALEALLAIERRLRLEQVDADMSALVLAVFERALWLLEAASEGGGQGFRKEDVFAVRAIARSMIQPKEAEDCLGRICRRRQAPAGLRGASLGALWSARASEGKASEELALEVCAAIASIQLGDFLSGLAITAREEMLHSGLLDAVDERVRALGDDEFLVALPPLRRAFSFFPPNERLDIAKRVLERRGVVMDRSALLRPVQLDAEAARIEAAVMELMKRYGLLSPEAS